VASPATGACSDGRDDPAATERLAAECADAVERTQPDSGPAFVRSVFDTVRSGRRSVALWHDARGEVSGFVAWEVVPEVGRRIDLWYLDRRHQNRDGLAALLDGFEAFEPLRGPVFVAPGAIAGVPRDDEAAVLSAADMIHLEHEALAFRAGREVPGAIVGDRWRFRPVEPGDRDALLALSGRAYREYPGQLWWTHVDLERDLAEYWNVLANGGHTVLPEGTFVLLADRAVRGWIVTSRDPSGPYIDSVQVDPKWQGRGIGRALLVRALTGLRDAGVEDDVGLVYLKENARAGALYRSVGFTPAPFTRPVARGHWIRRRTLRAVLERASTAKYR
jgi:ribosomal protein S18 acetylase RimI-like enzyme